MIKKTLCLIGLLTASLSFAQAPSSAGKTYVYYSINGEAKIKVYELNKTTEELTFVSEIATDGNPYPLVTNNSNSVLYSGNWVGNFNTGTGKIQSFTLDNETGNLANLNTADGIDIPVHISLSKNENYLLSASFGRNGIATQAIDTDGLVNSTLIEDINLPSSNNRNWPHMIKTNPAGDIVYATSMGADQINQYTFDENTGALTALAPNPINVAPTHDGPRHFVYHPTLDIAYFSNELNHKVMVIGHAATGLATAPIETIDLLPAGTTDGGQKTSDINITPDGKFLYVTVRRPNHTAGTIAAYTVNETTGALTLINRYDTEKVVRDFDITPDGEYVIVAGESSGNSVLYKIESNGALTQKQSIAVGSAPFWVLAVEIEGNLSNDKIIGAANFTISPNPFHDTFTINLNEPLTANDSIEVIDAKGTQVIVKTTSVSGNTVTVDLSDTETGVYFLKITQNGQTQIAKLLAI